MPRTLLALVAALVALLGSVAGCGPRPGPVRYVERISVGGAHVSDGVVWFPATRHALHEDSTVYLVSCLTSGQRAAEEGCSWVPAGRPGSIASTTRRREVIATAATEHDAMSAVTVQLADTSEIEGYWLAVCGTQRFYRWSEQRGRFGEVPTPAP